MANLRKDQQNGRRITTFTFLGTQERHELERLAEREGRSLSGQIRYIIRRELSKQTNAPTAPA